MTGVAPHARPPVEWSETKNVRWKVAIPGKGSATPVVWGDRLYVLTAVPGEKRAPAVAAPPAEPPAAGGRPRLSTPPDTSQKFTVLAAAAQRREGPLGACRPRGAAPRGHAPDRHLGLGVGGDRRRDRLRPLRLARPLRARHQRQGPLGEGPRRHEHQAGLRGGQLARPRSATGCSSSGTTRATRSSSPSTGRPAASCGGRSATRRPRGRRRSSSRTRAGRRSSTSATNKVRSYDGATGDLVWETTGMTQNAIPTPVHLDGLVLLDQRLPRQRAPRREARRGQGRHLRLAGRRLEARSGHPVRPVAAPLRRGALLPQGQQRPSLLLQRARPARGTTAPSGSRASRTSTRRRWEPTGASTSRAARARPRCVERGPVFKLLATNTLDDAFDASPVAVDSELYLRGAKHLYRISE